MFRINLTIFVSIVKLEYIFGVLTVAILTRRNALDIHHKIVFGEIDEADALGDPSDSTDITHWKPDKDAILGDHDKLVGIDHLHDTHHFTVTLGGPD